MKRRFSPLELIALAAALLGIIPLALLVLTSLKPDAEIVTFEGLLPRSPRWRTTSTSSRRQKKCRCCGGCLTRSSKASATTALVLAVSSLAAYGLFRLRLPYGGAVLVLLLATMTVPGQVLLVPTYLLLNKLGWIDTPLALIVPPAAGAFGVLMLSSFFRGIPKALEEAAAVDGCSRLGIYWHIMLPLARPILATLAIFVFLGSWNDFLGPLVYLDSADQYTLPVGVTIFQSSYSTDYGLTFAACVICTLPVLRVFLVFSRQIISGMTAGAVKE